MATCKDCIHYDVCEYTDRYIPLSDGKYCNSTNVEKIGCPFIDKSKIIELPCKVGDKVWWNTGLTIWERIVKGIIVYQNTMRLDLDDFQPIVNHKNLIYGEEEAKAKLKELNNNG